MKKIYSFLAAALLALGFAACEDVENPFPQPGQGGDESGDSTQVIAPAGDGTLENPFSAAAALAYTKALAADVNSDKEVYIKGIVVSIEEAYNTEHGNGSFTISDDGTKFNTFKIWRAKYLNNAAYQEGQPQVEVGDTVVVYGFVVNFKGNTPETAQGKAYLYSCSGKGSSTETPGGGDTPANPQGEGTLENPFNAAAANAYVAKLAADVNTEQDFYIKGKVASIEEAYNTQWGNGSFMISDDGTSANAFKVWRALYLGNKKYEAGQKQIKVGDEVVVCGKLVNYKGNTPETAQGNAYLYSLNGKTVAEAGEEPTEPTEPENPGAGDVENPNADASNGSFENWVNGKPVNWASTTSASKGSVKQSTEAHSGTYAVEVTGSGSGNNRLAYTELTLPAGDYTMTFWVKAATSEGGSVCPGYGPINADGSMGKYAYGTYVNDLTAEWQQVTHTFSLSAETKLNVVVMVSKKPGKNVIIDDFQLSDASGNFIIK